MMGLSRRSFLLRAFFALALIMLLPISDASGQTDAIIRVSVSSNGEQGNSESGSGHFRPDISADGRFVAFVSWADNLVADDIDTNETHDVFVHDRQSGATTRVSVSSTGGQANGESRSPAISADGRYVVFSSYATNLVSFEIPGAGGIYRHDRQTGQTTLVSLSSTDEPGNGGFADPTISSNGRYIAYASSASNLIDGDTSGGWHIYVYDRVNRLPTRVSVRSDGTKANGFSYYPTISANGRFVAFVSDATNLVENDHNDLRDVFVHDLETEETILASVSTLGEQANDSAGMQYPPVISADGRYVAFHSSATNLEVTDDTNGQSDIFVRDILSKITSRVSVSSSGEQANRGTAYPAISADGRYVAFSSSADNLITGNKQKVLDVYLHDRKMKQTTLISTGYDGGETGGGSYWPVLSADGRYVAFNSDGPNIVRNDTNSAGDVFLLDRQTSSSIGFLDLPFDYGSSPAKFYDALRNHDQHGLVNTWIDHDRSLGRMVLWDQTHLAEPEAKIYMIGTLACWDNDIMAVCYDNATGLDFFSKSKDIDVLIYPAAKGKIVQVSNRTCPNNGNGCGGGYGNSVLVHHVEYGYFTRYSHLQPNTIDLSFVPGTEVSRATVLGKMGNSGASGGTHLDFEVYKDSNNSGIWDDTGVDKLVDPFGWTGNNQDDPLFTHTGVPNRWLWRHPRSSSNLVQAEMESLVSDITDRIAVRIPAGYFNDDAEVEISIGEIVGGTLIGWRRLAPGFTLTFLRFPVADEATRHELASVAGATPISITLQLSGTTTSHIDDSLLTLHRWDSDDETWQVLPTSVDVERQLVSATTTELGHFGLFAPLLCPADTTEPDDKYYAARPITVEGEPVSRLFDTHQDEDWLILEAQADTIYSIQTTDMANSVHTAIDIFDLDGISLLRADDGSGDSAPSQFLWQAPQTGLYFLRIYSTANGVAGCDASYKISVTSVNVPPNSNLFLPMLQRQ